MVLHDEEKAQGAGHTAGQYRERRHPNPNAHAQGRKAVLTDASQLQVANLIGGGHREACQDGGNSRRTQHRKRGKRAVAHRTLTGLLRSTTFSHVYGEKLPNGIFPSLNKKQFIGRYNSGWFDSLSNEDFDLHFQGQETFYFFGTPYVDWLDNSYQPPSGKGAKDGICCKWRLDEAFAVLLMAAGGNVGIDFRGEGENLVPQMRMLREEAEWRQETLFWEAAEREIEAIFQKAA
jgi:hypothetical protein